MERHIIEIRSRMARQAVAQLAVGGQFPAHGRIARLPAERLRDHTILDLHVTGRYMGSGNARYGGKDSPGYQRRDAHHPDSPQVDSSSCPCGTCPNFFATQQ